jgi:hypothetical protein
MQAAAKQSSAPEDSVPARHGIQAIPAVLRRQLCAIKDCAECPDMVSVAQRKPGHETGQIAESESGGRWSNVQQLCHRQDRSHASGSGKPIMGDNPSRWSPAARTARSRNINWKDIGQFIRKINRKTSRNYPTSLLMQIKSSRGGGLARRFSSTTPLRWKSQASYIANSRKAPRPVAGKKPNAFGLYDLYGRMCRNG